MRTARSTTCSRACRAWPSGFTLLELMVVIVIMGVLIGMSLPRFGRAIEQSRADIAAANLRAIWSAERLYWLEHRAYTAELPSLQALGLLDPAVVMATSGYVYAVPSATDRTFTATATRAGSTSWIGAFAIDEVGSLSGSVTALGGPEIVPGFQ